MGIFGSDGVEMIEKRLHEQLTQYPEHRTFTIHVNSLLALIAYYKKLTDLCDHDWDTTSPVDGAEFCRNCGQLRLI